MMGAVRFHQTFGNDEIPVICLPTYLPSNPAQSNKPSSSAAKVALWPGPSFLPPFLALCDGRRTTDGLGW